MVIGEMHRRQVKADQRNENDDSATPQEAELQEGRDYYVEAGLFVFTATFLRQRGYCCESGVTVPISVRPTSDLKRLK
jgi:hypothetical protein